ncbi:MAG TPA: transcription antitermination factor NusB [Acidobacteriaceae bacterium]|jgi:16S rRNA (cytosine967-C5)-methyltransferase|nr:transcription antitermination factor NusB [Acidobacteriaceae bacterium]
MTANIAPARHAAFHILQKIHAGKENSDTLLHSAWMQPLSQLDKNLCTALVLGTLRWQTILDAMIRQRLSEPSIQLPNPVSLALRLGAFQLLFMDRIPAHAAIFESVEWVKQSENPRAAGLVNAVLRKLATTSKPIEISEEQAYPEWIVQRWRKNYGDNTAQKICFAGLQEPAVSLRVFDPSVVDELIADGVQLNPGAFLSQARIVVSGDASASRAVRDGHAQFQDEGSQLIAELLGQGKQILDCCAAPGGKTAILLENNPQAKLIACDVSPARLKAMRQRLARPEWQQRIEFHVADAEHLPEIGYFDRILCDVPCSGTGTLARNPEIRHRLQPQDISRHAMRQRGILTATLRRLVVGGRLLYATCSLEPEENEDIVRACLETNGRSHATYALVDLQAECEDRMRQGVIAGASAEYLLATGFRAGYLRTLPGTHPGDGFFAALIERTN